MTQPTILKGFKSCLFLQFCHYIFNKKVLLREHKRHTAHFIASACYAGGGTPSQVWGVPCLRSRRGTLSQVWGVPHLRFRGYPVPGLGGTPSQVWGGTPSLVWGVPHPRSGGYPVPAPGGFPRYPPIPDLGWGTPPGQTWDGVPPPTSVDRYTDWCQNITFPCTTYAGGKNVLI